MISLTEELLIGEGKDRRCYRHPSDPALCIKVLRSGWRTKVRMLRELFYYRKLERQGYPFEELPAYRGIAQTNLGKGYLYELVVDHDDQVSQPLAVLLQKEYDGEQLADDLRKLHDSLVRYNVPLADISRHNILVQLWGPEKYDLKVVDGVGNSDFIKIADLVPAWNRSKITRKFNRMFGFIGLPGTVDGSGKKPGEVRPILRLNR